MLCFSPLLLNLIVSSLCLIWRPLTIFLGSLPPAHLTIFFFLNESMTLRFLSVPICFSVIQFVHLPRLLIRWMSLVLPLLICLSTIVLSGVFSTSLLLYQTLSLQFSIYVYSCMNHGSLIYTLSSAFYATS